MTLINKAIWGDHSPKYAAAIPALMDLFPTARIIHIIRDGRDCAISFNRRFGQNMYRAVSDWKMLINRAQRDGQMIGNHHYHEITYETLTASPEHSFRQICDFLEIPFSKEVLKSNMPMFDKTASDNTVSPPNTVVKNSGKWRTVLPPHQLAKVENIAGKLLDDLGYEVQNKTGNKALNKNYLVLVKILDKVNAAISFYKRDKGPNMLKTFILQIKTALKQNKYSP